jgi:hypothetical protein
MTVSLAWTDRTVASLRKHPPDHLRGRVIGVYLLALGGFLPIGALVAGALAEPGGAGLACPVAGLAGLASTALVLVQRRS